MHDPSGHQDSGGTESVDSALDGSTVGTGIPRASRPRQTVPGLTVLAHPDPGRVGDRAPLALERGGSAVSVSRTEPPFVGLDGATARPLADRHLSRRPMLRIERRERLTLVPQGQRLSVHGVEAEEPIPIDDEALRRGVVLVMANRVALLLHPMTVPLPVPDSDFGIVGVSRASIETQQEIGRVCDLRVPVLLLGETGTGKELVARAIHERGARAHGPFVAVNMAALPPTVAAAELFGATKGAFTGAERSRPGLIRQAAAGTLFLDEVGAMPSEVQVLLLRFLEGHEVRSLGATTGEKVDVRVVAATDSDLDQAVDEGRFSRALLQRFGGYELQLQPLRARKDDLGLLLLHFLRVELAELGKSRLLLDPGLGRLPWLPARLLSSLADHSWPGNVRELRNVAQRIAIRYHDVEEVEASDIEEWLRVGDDRPSTPLPERPPRRRALNKRYRSPDEVSDEELETVMRECRWEIRQSAEKLGVSRPSLYNLIDRHPVLRKAVDLEEDEIVEAHRACSGDLEALVERLQVSRTALKARLRTLGLRPTPGGG